MRKLLHISKIVKKRPKTVYRLSHYNYKELIASGEYDRIYNGRVYTILSPTQFANLLGRLIGDGVCINLKGYHKDNLFPPLRTFNKIRTDAAVLEKGKMSQWGRDTKGKPQLVFLGGYVVLAIDGELAVSAGFYNFRTNYAGPYLEKIHARLMKDVQYRLKTCYTYPKRKNLPFIYQQAKNVNQKTNQAESGEDRGK